MILSYLTEEERISLWLIIFIHYPLLKIVKRTHTQNYENVICIILYRYFRNYTQIIYYSIYKIMCTTSSSLLPVFCT